LLVVAAGRLVVVRHLCSVESAVVVLEELVDETWESKSAVGGCGGWEGGERTILKFLKPPHPRFPRHPTLSHQHPIPISAQQNDGCLRSLLFGVMRQPAMPARRPAAIVHGTLPNLLFIWRRYF
jgi:hypothetical protein